MKTKHILVDMEKIGLEQMMKSVSLRLETQADRTLRVRECCRRDCSSSTNDANRAGMHPMIAAKYTVALSAWSCKFH
jgi:hypothetical protein